MTATLAITMGDPAGIGPEIIVKAARRLRGRLDMGALRLLVIGHASALANAQRLLGGDVAIPVVEETADWPALSLLPAADERGELAVGQIAPEGGRFAYYAVERAVRLAQAVGMDKIVAHADPLVARVHAGLQELGITALSAAQPGCSSGIVAFKHENSAAINDALLAQNIHVMHQVGRIRIAVHGYNTAEDIDKLLAALRSAIGG